jgi:hypothetical protein
VTSLAGVLAIPESAALGAPRPHHGAIYVPMLSMPELLPAIELGWAGVSFTLKDAVVVLGAGCAGLAESVYAGLVGSIQPDQFDVTVSLLAAVVIVGGQFGVAGAAVGALVVGGYDRVLVGALEDGLHTLGATLGVPGLQVIDVRGQNFAVSALALYLATAAQSGGAPRVVPNSWCAWPTRAVALATRRRPAAR